MWVRGGETGAQSLRPLAAPAWSSWEGGPEASVL